jgi:putative ABC transport system permease protein
VFFPRIASGTPFGAIFMKAFFSFYSDALKIALQSIFAHKLRAFLTLIGIIIGVAAVTTVGASISGLNTYVVDKVAKILGSNHFMIARMAFSGHMSDEEFERRNRRNKRLNWDDYEWVRDHCASCAEVGAATGTGTDLKQDGIEFPGAVVFGATANMVDIEDKTIEDGRFLSADEVQRSAFVVVLGGDIKDKFFPNQDAIGKTLKIRGLPMRVVGVEEKRGSFFGDSVDRHVTFRSRHIFKFLGETICRYMARARLAKVCRRPSKTLAWRCESNIDSTETKKMTSG